MGSHAARAAALNHTATSTGRKAVEAGAIVRGAFSAEEEGKLGIASLPLLHGEFHGAVGLRYVLRQLLDALDQHRFEAHHLRRHRRHRTRCTRSAHHPSTTIDARTAHRASRSARGVLERLECRYGTCIVRRLCSMVFDYVTHLNCSQGFRPWYELGFAYMSSHQNMGFVQ